MEFTTNLNSKKQRGKIAMSDKNYKEIGKVVFLEGKIFYCPKCDKRFDYAILYDKYPDKPSCKVCNSDTVIKKAGFRFGIPHPKRGGW